MDNIQNFALQSFLHSYLKKSSSSLDFTDELTPFVKKLKYTNGEIDPHIYNISYKICEQVNDFIYNTKEIVELGIKFNIHLVGGCLRDLLLGNHYNIKDLDLVFEIRPYSTHNRATLEKTTIGIIKKIIGSESAITQTEWDSFSQTQQMYFIIFETLSKKYNIKNTVTLADLKKKGASLNQDYIHMLNKELEAVITVEKDGNYPFDILLTNSSIKEYVRTFSFEICKVSASFLDADTPKLVSSVYEFFNNIKFYDDFLMDAKEKKVTLNMPNHRSAANVQKIMEKHYPRILNKYPNHTLNLLDGGVEEYVNWKKSYQTYTGLQGDLKTIDINKGKPVKI